jgi:hypothetical protein
VVWREGERREAKFLIISLFTFPKLGRFSREPRKNEIDNYNFKYIDKVILNFMSFLTKIFYVEI